MYFYSILIEYTVFEFKKSIDTVGPIGLKLVGDYAAKRVAYLS